MTTVAPCSGQLSAYNQDTKPHTTDLRQTDSLICPCPMSILICPCPMSSLICPCPMSILICPNPMSSLIYPCPVSSLCPMSSLICLCPMSSLSVRVPCPVYLSVSHVQSYLCPMSTLIHPFPMSITRITDTHKCPKVFLPGSFSLSKLVLRRALMIYTLLMNSNKLRLNTDQTEIMPLGSASRLNLVGSEIANTGGNKTPFKPSVKRVWGLS